MIRLDFQQYYSLNIRLKYVSDKYRIYRRRIPETPRHIKNSSRHFPRKRSLRHFLEVIRHNFSKLNFCGFYMKISTIKHHTAMNCVFSGTTVTNVTFLRHAERSWQHTRWSHTRVYVSHVNFATSRQLEWTNLLITGTLYI